MSKTNSTVMQDFDEDDYPKVTKADFARATLRVGGKQVSEKEWQDAVRAKLPPEKLRMERFRQRIEELEGAFGAERLAEMLADSRILAISPEDIKGYFAVQAALQRSVPLYLDAKKEKLLLPGIALDQVIAATVKSIMEAATGALTGALVVANEDDQKKPLYKEKHRRPTHHRRVAG